MLSFKKFASMVLVIGFCLVNVACSGGGSSSGGDTDSVDNGRATCKSLNPVDRSLCSRESFFYGVSPERAFIRLVDRREFPVSIEARIGGFVLKETYVSVSLAEAAGAKLYVILANDFILIEDRLWEYYGPTGLEGYYFSGVPEANGQSVPLVFFDHPFKGEGTQARAALLAGYVRLFRFTANDVFGFGLTFPAGGVKFSTSCDLKSARIVDKNDNLISDRWYATGNQNVIEIDALGFTGDIRELEFQGACADGVTTSVVTTISPFDLFSNPPTSSFPVRFDSVHGVVFYPEGVTFEFQLGR